MRLALTVTAFLLVFVARAEAGTVTADVFDFEEPHGARRVEAVVRFDAGQGERNAVLVTGDTRSFRLVDTGVAPVAGRGCVGDGPDAVRCSLPPLPATAGVRVEIDAGDGPDALTADRVAVGVWLLGRGGDDAVTVVGASAVPYMPSGDLDGGAGDDVLTGGDGYDVIRPGAGTDTVVAGGGDDFVFADGDGRVPSADRLDGGVGSDTVSYLRRTRGVRVDLLSGVAGAPGEGDLVAGLENVWGSSVADVLAGDDGPNRIEGGRSRAGDRILGRGGNDVLEGGGGGDELVGGDGDDQLVGMGGPDRLDGGTGADRYDMTRYGDRGPVAMRCEGLADRVHVYDSGPVRVPRRCAHLVVENVSLVLRRDGAAELRSLAVRRFAADRPAPCRLRATFSRGGRTVAVARVRGLSSGRERVAAVQVRGARRRAVVNVAWDWRCRGRFRSNRSPVRFTTEL